MSVPVRRDVVTGGKALIQDRLAEYFRASSPANEIPRRIAALSNDATAATARCLAHAWAVRRLQAAFPHDRVRQLQPRSRWIVQDMLADHLAALQQEAGLALNLLEPVLGKNPALSEIDIPAAEAGEATGDLFALASQTDRLSRGVFALARLDEGEEPQAAARLVENLARLRLMAPALRALAARENETAVLKEK